MNPDTIATPARILLVEDDCLFASTLARSLQAAGHAVTVAASAEEALGMPTLDSFDLAIIDEALPAGSALQLATLLGERFRLPFIFLATVTCEPDMGKLIGAGALACLVKPPDAGQLLPMVATALARSAELASLRETRDQLQEALDQERDISIATGIVMARMNLDRPAAFELIRRTARSGRRKLADVARDLVANRGDALKTEAFTP